MERLQRNMQAHPGGSESLKELEVLKKAVLTSTTCLTCADACLGEKNPKSFAECARLNLDCAAICDACVKLLSRPDSANYSFLYRLIETCQDVCDACADECEKFADSREHCRISAHMCRECIKACSELML